MRFVDVTAAFAVVVLVSLGQVLIRLAAKNAQSMREEGVSAWLSPTMALAILIYGAAMLMWLWLLGRLPVAKAFGFFGLCFFLVPLLADRMLGIRSRSEPGWARRLSSEASMLVAPMGLEARATPWLRG